MLDYVGRTFVMGKVDCFTLVRDFYNREYGILLPNVARPDEFWEHGLSPYLKHYATNGFEMVDAPPQEWQRGDVIFMAIMSEQANHAAIVVENGQILHHVFGRLSTIEDYKGVWRNNTTGVYRHKDVENLQPPVEEVDIRDLLPEWQRRAIADATSGQV